MSVKKVPLYLLNLRRIIIINSALDCILVQNNTSAKQSVAENYLYLSRIDPGWS